MDSCNKAVMIPVSPRRCGLIASGEEDIEIKKTRPKIEVPFKCYIYCTKKHGVAFWTGPRYSYADDHSHNAFDRCGNGKVIGEFICDYIDEYQAEFTDLNIYDSLDNNVCQNTISKIIGYNEDDDVEERQYITGNEEENPDDCELMKKSCLTFNELRQYIGETFYDKSFYGYHISDLKIYDQPKELSEFKRCLSVVEKKLLYDQDLGYAGLVCDGCPHAKWENYHLVQCQNATCASRRVSPPQNLCYVEGLKKI